MNEERETLAKPVDYDELFPGRFIKSGEFKGRSVTIEIAAVDRELLPDKNGGKKVRGIVAIKTKPGKPQKDWALNSTNGQCLRAMFGRKPQEWVGHKVHLYPAPYEGETAIRVWGSPEIEQDTVIVIELPRKKPFKMTMHKESNYRENQS